MSRTASIPQLSGGSLLGHVTEFRRSPIDMLLRIGRDYPDIVRIRLGVTSPVIIGSPALVQEVLVDKEDAFIKTYGLSIFARPLLGRGLLALEGDAHRKRRRLLAPPFTARRVMSYADEIGRRAERSAQRLAAQAKHGTIDMSKEAMGLTLEVVLKTLFDAEVDAANAAIARAFPEALNSVVDSLFSPLPLPPPIPTPSNVRMLRAVRELDAIVYRIIGEHRAAQASPNDLLNILMAARDQDDGSSLTDREVRDEVMTAMLAGHETTANALAWSLYALARAPRVRASLEQEVDRIADPVLGAHHMEALPWTLQVVKEAMRLYPPVYLIARRCTRDVEIGPYRLKRGAGVFINIAGMQRRPDIYPDPERFDPTRFEPEREKRLPKQAYLPFSGGPRVCIGNHFALMEAQLILATWIRRLRFELPVPDQTAAFESLMVLRPEGGLPMRVSPRRAERDASAAHAVSKVVLS